MSWLTRVLFLFLLFLAVGYLRSWVARLLKPLIRPDQTGQGRKGPAPEKELLRETVKDPQCGMYVARDLALTTRIGSHTHYFCSEDCRAIFLRQQRSP